MKQKMMRRNHASLHSSEEKEGVSRNKGSFASQTFSFWNLSILGHAHAAANSAHPAAYNYRTSKKKIHWIIIQCAVGTDRHL